MIIKDFMNILSFLSSLFLYSSHTVERNITNELAGSAVDARWRELRNEKNSLQENISRFLDCWQENLNIEFERKMVDFKDELEKHLTEHGEGKPVSDKKKLEECLKIYEDVFGKHGRKLRHLFFEHLDLPSSSLRLVQDTTREKEVIFKNIMNNCLSLSDENTRVEALSLILEEVKASFSFFNEIIVNYLEENLTEGKIRNIFRKRFSSNDGNVEKMLKVIHRDLLSPNRSSDFAHLCFFKVGSNVFCAKEFAEIFYGEPRR